MDWKSLAKDVGAVAPLLGTLLAGPSGAAAGGLVASALGCGSSPDDVAQALGNPEAVSKLRQIEATRQIELQRLVVSAEGQRLAAETSAIQAVNATMQAEAKADHWPTYSWRPAIGFCVGFNTAVASVLVLIVFAAVVLGSPQAAAAVAQLPAVLGALAAINATVLPILGIASWFRGKAQADPGIATDNRG
jgi:hypothetical protein